MLLYLFIFIESGFIIGLVGMFLGTLNKAKEDRSQRWIKFIFYFFIGEQIMAALGVDILTSGGSVIACLSNIGPGLGQGRRRTDGGLGQARGGCVRGGGDEPRRARTALRTRGFG